MKTDPNKKFCNEKVFSDFFKNQSKPLYNYLYYKCGDAELANDLAQDAFIKFWHNCKKVIFGKQTSFLFTIANNLFLNAYKKSKLDIAFKNEPQINHTNQSPEFVLEDKQFGEKLQKHNEQIF